MEALGLTTLFLAAVACVVVFFPAEGRVLVPVHQALSVLLGQTTFLVPLAMGLAATLAFARRARPSLVLPRKRLVGLGAITFGLLPAEHLLGQSTGLVGEWFTGGLIGVAGGPCTVAFTLAVLVLGAALTF
ncbi:MAG TPA: hypothetical protein VGJ60_11195, partial [Chloroflexota bacterium]